MGHEPGSFTYAGLVQGLPSGYGKHVAAQMIAAALHHNLCVPLVTPEEASRSNHLAEILVELADARRVTHPDTAWAATVVQRWWRRRSMNSERIAAVAEREFDADTTTPQDWPGPYRVTLDDQKEDPGLAEIIESLTAVDEDRDAWSKPRARRAIRHENSYMIMNELLQHLTNVGPKIVVPIRKRADLLHAHHCVPPIGAHRGERQLYAAIRKYFTWPSLYTDCCDHVARCEVCRDRDPQGFGRVPSATLGTPPYPFHTIYIDHKKVPRKSKDGYKVILIVVCGLTRYTLAIPLKSTSSEETLAALVKYVYSYFSFPQVIRSDNACASDLTTEMADYAGLRHVAVLPFNPQSNGPAEQGVRRVSELIMKHTALYADWPAALPTLTYVLNTAINSSTEVSPFFAVFGREPNSVPELENPVLIKNELHGHEFVITLSDRLRRAWKDVQDTSEGIRSDVLRRAEKTRREWPKASDEEINGIRVGDKVLLKHGGHSHAAAQRKHGYPLARTFEVLKLNPESHSLQLDPRNTGIKSTVSIRLCKKAPPEWAVFDDGSVSAGRFENPTATVKGMRGNPFEVGGKLDDDYSGPTYPVETVLRAAKSRGKWRYLVKYLGYEKPVWNSSQILRDAGSDVQEQMQEARRLYSSTARASVAREAEIPDDEGQESTDPHVASPPPASRGSSSPDIVPSSDVVCARYSPAYTSHGLAGLCGAGGCQRPASYTGIRRRAGTLVQ